MFTSIDKAIVAVIMGAVYLVNTFTGLDLGFVTPETINTVMSFVGPILVWLIPNKA